jgi:rSAM/selenodomain-associated transferase 1
MNKDLVIVFLRAPELGKVKTRLAATMGDERALVLYERLLEHTVNTVAKSNTSKQAWYADAVPLGDRCAALGFEVHAQRGVDLGERMQHAFHEAFGNGFDKVVIIGTDLPDMSTTLLADAFDRLGTHDAVLGPARDGGYYLLGLRSMEASLFRNKTWSGPSVAADTIADLELAGRSLAVLPMLIDVDTEADLKDVIMP